MTATLTRDGEVFVLDLGDDENRFAPDWLDRVEEHLHTVEVADGARALVTRATGKFFSNGLDLDWLGQHLDEYDAYIARVHRLLSHFLRLPVHTVAACQGHTFAAGAMLSLAHDTRVMRADRGFWSLPEVQLGMPFTPGMAALIQSRLAPQVAHEAMVTGRRYGGTEAAAYGIVDHAVAEDDVLPTAMRVAATHQGLAGDNLGVIKAGMYAGTLAALRTPVRALAA
ncbi:enoyl-CoA hydratase/isomerase family protein [Luteipulveratus halotolerans]|uniref:Enoyl-CoA hydratase n=1 Tax=Luteipulveratus halotolerans TaxID=1631356 RepID=A0A0L6CLF4_9MICO|nr:enoyl-CoA hydratase/isomerase family protein [Luteipulveratus halotolerans]KNX38631.1 enoyl-CoA hydratase [Luteipulveratus halotolerans]